MRYLRSLLVSARLGLIQPSKRPGCENRGYGWQQRGRLCPSAVGNYPCPRGRRLKVILGYQEAREMLKQASYTVIDKTELPPLTGRHGSIPIWWPIFDPLPLDKAICFECETRQIAARKGVAIQGSLRKHRCSYRVSSRRIPNGDGTYKLYCWKEARNGQAQS